MDITEVFTQAGTEAKGDVAVYVDLFSTTEGIELELISKLECKYGESIRSAVLETLSEMQVTKARVKIVDKGALDFVIRARVETAVARAFARKEHN